jgi:hypothetical protein
VDPRDVFMEHVNLSRGLEREHVHYHGHDYTLRGSETRTLTTVGVQLTGQLVRAADRDSVPPIDRRTQAARQPSETGMPRRNRRASQVSAVFARQLSPGDGRQRLRRPS